MAILENQNVAKRQSKARSSNYSSDASYGHNYNSEFMSHFEQKPERSRKKESQPDSFSYFSDTIKQFVKPSDRKRKTNRAFRREFPRSSGNKRQSSGFSFPIPSFAKTLIIAGTIFVAVIALKWEDSPEGFTADIKKPETYAIQLSAENSDSPITNYASTGVPSLKIPEIGQNGQKTVNIEPSTEVSENAFTAEQATQAVAPQAEQELSAPAQTSIVVPAAVSEEKDSPRILRVFEWQQHTVQQGETVSSIAQKFGVSYGAVIASNEIKNARRLPQGAVLRIPNIDGVPYQIKAGDNVSKIAVLFDVPQEVILDVNDMKSDKIIAGKTLFIPGGKMNNLDLRKALGELFIRPTISNHVTSDFGMRIDPIAGHSSQHTGIDLRARTGEPIMASMEGTVSVVREDRIYGKHIILTHPNGYKTLYAHLSSFSVKQGKKVIQGEKIGEAGSTGYSTASHLHFGVYDKGNKLVDPRDLINL